MAGPGLTLCDLRMLDNALNFVVMNQEDLTNILHQVADMDSFGLWCDSYFMLFKTSDREAMKEEIVKYRDLYIKMKNVIKHCWNGAEDADELIMGLYDMLPKMRFEARWNVVNTESNTLYRLYKKFENNYQLLENMVKNLEVVALRQQLNKARYDLKKIQAVLDDLRQEMQQLVKENTVIKTQLEDLLRRQ